MVERLVTAQVNRWTRVLDMHDVDVISFARASAGCAGCTARPGGVASDDWAAAGVGHRAWLQQRQLELMRQADVVTGVSRALVADCRSLGADALHIPNGCDVQAFAAPAAERRGWPASPDRGSRSRRWNGA